MIPEWVYFPDSKEEVGYFYLLWTLLYLATHILWDFLSKKTPPFELKNLKDDINILWSGTTIATSLLLLFAVPQPALLTVVGDITLPLIIAGMSGVLIALSNLQP